MSTRYCPKCDEEMDHQDDDPDTGIIGGWYCEACDLAVEDDPYDDPDLDRP